MMLLARIVLLVGGSNAAAYTLDAPISHSDLNVTPPSVNVFREKLGGVSCYRIPSIVQTASGVLVAFAEARVGSCGDGAVHSIGVRRSLDHGKSWGNVSFVKGPKDSMVGNPTAIYTKSGKIVLIYVLHSAKCQADCGTGNGVSVSSDLGETWGAPLDVSKMWGAASGSLPGPGNGVQTSTGRLLVAAHHSAYQRDYVVYSDTDGKTWTPLKQTFAKMDEATMTQLTNNGSVVVNMRHQNSKTRGRAFALSHDDGLTFGPIQFDATLISPVCQASLVTFGGSTYFSNPESVRRPLRPFRRPV
jgi:sialidase-1